MGKLYAERLIRIGDDESLIPNETFVLRFKKLEIDSLKIKPPFKVILHQEKPVHDVEPIVQPDAEEGTFIATLPSDGDVLQGIFKDDNATQYTQADFEFRAYYSEEEEVTTIPADQLTDIIAAGYKDAPVPSGEDVSFSVSTLNKTAGALDGMTWTIMDGKGENVMTDLAGESTGKDTITLNFPASNASEVQQYTIRVTTALGQVKEKKVLLGLSDAQLTSEPPANKVPISRPKEVQIDKGIHSGTTVSMAPITFSVKNWKGKKAEHNKNTDKISWIVYKGTTCDNPILLKQNAGTTCTIDFTSLPEGAYRVEAFAQYSEWHVKKGLNIYNEPFTKVKDEVFRPLNVTSAKNAVEGIKTDALVVAKNKQQQTNWGVPVQFNADLLFDDVAGDISQLHWELKNEDTKEIVMKEETDAAEGKSAIQFEFEKSEAGNYSLTLSLNGVSKTRAFTVVTKAYVKTIALQTDIKNKRLVNNEDKDVTFKVTGYTQKQANKDDPGNVKWVRIFFPGLKVRDYSDTIKLTFVGDEPVGAYMNGQKGLLEHFSGSDTLTVKAGMEDTLLKGDAYWKGLYIVEAYTGKPDGKSSSEFHDMEYYEIISNEPATITQTKLHTVSGKSTEKDLTSHGFMRTYGTNSDEYFTFKVNSWLFQQEAVDGSNVRWGLFKNKEDIIPEVKFLEKGSEVKIRTGKEGDYFLKAWMDDVSLAAVLPVTIENAKIAAAFFADSSGKRISTCGVGDKVYLYFETKGLAQEEVQVNVFEEDSWGDELIKGLLVEPNDNGIIFQELVLTQTILSKGENEGTDSQLYLTLSLDTDSPVKLASNEYFERTQLHYYINDTKILDVINDKKAVDFNFVDPSDNLVLDTPVLYGSKAKVRVRITNKKDADVYIYLFDVGAKKGRAIPESQTPVKVNEEGFAEMEFVVPEDWKASHTGKDTDSRIFVPYISYDQKTSVMIDNSTKPEKSLHVVKTMPTQSEIDALNLRKGIELAKLPVKPKVSSGAILVTADDLKAIVGGTFTATQTQEIEKLVPYLNQYMDMYGINKTPVRMAHFLGQASVETNFRSFVEGFNHSVERLCGSQNLNKDEVSNPDEKGLFGTFKTTAGIAKAREWGRPKGVSTPVSHENQVKIANWAYAFPGSTRNGNNGVAETDVGNEQGDGYKYRGRGLWQLTGRSIYNGFNTWYQENYVTLGLGAVDFMNNPEKLEEPLYNVLSAVYYWDHYNMSALADEGTTYDASYAVSKAVNSGYAAKDRYDRTKSAYDVLFAKPWTINSEYNWHNPLAEMALRGNYSSWDPEMSVKSEHIPKRNSGKHDGLDIFAPDGTEIYAVLDGTIKTTGVWGGYGDTILLEAVYGGKTYYFQYSHLSQIDVTSGQKNIKAGDLLGKTGHSGNADKEYPHLHFEVLSSYPAKVRVNPVAEFPELARTLDLQPDKGSQPVY